MDQLGDALYYVSCGLRPPPLFCRKGVRFKVSAPVKTGKEKTGESPKQ